MDFSERIKSARLAAGLSQPELAKRVGVTKNAISSMELGKTKGPKPHHLFRIAWALNISPEWLATGKGKMEPDRYASVEVRNGVVVTTGDSVRIPWLRATLSMGPGVPADADHDQQIKAFETTRRWVRAKLAKASAPENIRIVTGLGDSMKGTYNDGDALFVDVGVTAADVDAVYAFQHNGELYIKRVQRLPGGRLKLISDNRKVYDPIVVEHRDVPDFRVIGRVIGVMNFNEL